MRVSILCVLLLTAAPALAQHQHHTSQAAPELLTGLGSHHHPITTKSADAQRYFDQGLILLYGFNHDEAVRYFRHAAELDPQAAMPHWGIALAIGPNYNDTAVDADRARATHEAVRAALERASASSSREQDYIRALAKRYPTPEAQSDWKKFHVEYSEAMRALTKKYPDDLDAATMFAESLMMLRPWQLWTATGEPAPGTLELVAVLESVLKRNPDHPAANHFYIHAVEASPNLERAIPSAARLMTLVPAAGHLVHMPGHIYLQTGDYELAARTNVEASAADEAFVKRTGATGMYPQMYWTHNMHFIAYARAQQGRYDEAQRAAQDMVRNVGEGDLQPQMQMLEGFLLYPLMIDLRFGRWDEILRTPEPRPERNVLGAFRHYARAMAHTGRGETAEAQTEARRFEALRDALPEDSLYLINNKASDLLALAAATLDAHRAARRGDHEKAIAAWRSALEREAAIQYDEPPAWFYPVRQSLGGALLRAGKPAEAEAVFREALARHPRDGRLLYGLWQSLRAQERVGEAAFVEQEFRTAWKDATAQLRPEDL